MSEKLLPRDINIFTGSIAFISDHHYAESFTSAVDIR